MSAPNYQPEEYAEAPASFDFHSIYFALKEKAWLIILCVAAASFLTWAYLKRCPRTYAATVVLQVESERPKILGNAVQDVMPDDRGPEALKTIEKVLQSRSLLERVIVTNNLATDPRFMGETNGPALSSEQLISRLGNMVHVGVQMGTRLMNITVEHTDPKLTQVIANSLVKEFILRNFEQHLSVSEISGLQLQEKAEQWQKKWEEAEKSLNDYRKTNSMSVSLEERQDIVVQKMQELNRTVTDAENDRIRLETEFAQIQSNRTGLAALLILRSITTDAAVADLRVKIAQQEVDIGNLKKRYLPKHPKYMAAQSQLWELHSALSNAVGQAVGTLQRSFESAKGREAELRKSLANQKQEVIKLSDQLVEYKRLSAIKDSAREMRDAAMKRLNEISNQKDVDQGKISVIQSAYVPEKPIKPDKVRILLMGLMSGLLVGVLLAVGTEALDSSLKTPDQTESFMKQPLLTVIPRVRSAESDKNQWIMTEDKECFAAEAFRTLRTNLSMGEPETRRRIFLFTSALPEEGKTFCALNFASCLAQQGLRTLLIEADLRCPALERAMGLETGGALGLSDFLTEHLDLPSVAHTTDLTDLLFIPAGTRSGNPSELLGLGALASLLQEALLQFDRIVIDSAPLLPVSDTLLLVSRVQTVGLVVRAGKTPRRSVQRAAQMLQNANAPLAGIVFNGLNRTRGEEYYDYSYYSDYGEKAVTKT